jgi:hypothetical protein
MKNILFVVLLLCSIDVLGQKKQNFRPDTVYYLADTSKTPVKDRMLNINTEVYSRQGKLDTIQAFRIICNCLPFGYYPTFTRHLSQKRRLMTRKELEKIKLVSLPDLLSLVLKNYDHDFSSKHSVIIIEATKNEYFSGEVFLTHFSGPTQDSKPSTTN